MSELIKEISFDITKTQEVDLGKPCVLKKRRRKRNDDYDYDDDFIESFEGETDLVDIECSLPNFFVYQGPLPYSTKKVLNFFKNKPNLTYENDNEVDVLEEALCISRRRRKNNTVTSSKKINENKKNGAMSRIDENLGIFDDTMLDNSEDNKKIARNRKPRMSDKKIFRYKEMIVNYLYGKLYKFRENFSKLSTDDKIWFFIVNFLFYRDDELGYRENLQIIIEDKNSKFSKSEDNLRKTDEFRRINSDLKKPEDSPSKFFEAKTVEYKIPQERRTENSEENDVKNLDINKNIASEVNVNLETPKDGSDTTTNLEGNKDNSCIIDKGKGSNKYTEDMNIQSFDNLTQINKNPSSFNYSSPIPFTPSKHSNSSKKFFHSPSIDPVLYPLLKEFFTDNELNLFVSRMISKIDTAFMSITVYGNNERMYASETRRFLGFTDKGFKDECMVYFSSFVVKHYSNNTSQDIIHYYHEAKKSVMDAFLPYMSNKVKTLYFVNNYFRSTIEEDKYDY
ncbi:hypothetical protein P3W45_001335 [Vairimorpha bombi]|jgi:hypothetical protein